MGPVETRAMLWIGELRLRVCSGDDERRARRMQAQLANGRSAARPARAELADELAGRPVTEAARVAR